MKKIVALALCLIMALSLATVAFGATTTTLYKQDSTDDTGWAKVTGCVDMAGVPADFVVDADYDFAIGGNLEYYEVNDGTSDLPFVEATKATGEYKLVCGNVVVYLNTTTTAKVGYRYQADVFTAVTTDDEACGKLCVAKNALDKTYYVVYDDDDEVDAYYVKDSNGGTKLLVDGKIVKVKAANTFNSHVWVGNEVNADKEYTSVKCDNCGKVAKLYANADAAGKNAEYVAGLGWITAADAGYGATAAAGVTSAKTFDAGVALYAGMALMSVAGSAVVIGKKKEF